MQQGTSSKYSQNNQELKCIFSFLKDAIISAVSPKIAKTSVSSQLVQKVENRTFNEDWIADPLHDRMTGVYREKRTVIYDIGTAVVDLVSKMMNFFCRMVVRVLLGIQWTINYVSNSAVALVIFAARSIFCTVSSCMLIVCHFLQARHDIFSYNCYDDICKNIIYAVQRLHFDQFECSTMVSNGLSLGSVLSSTMFHLSLLI